MSKIFSFHKITDYVGVEDDKNYLEAIAEFQSESGEIEQQRIKINGDLVQSEDDFTIINVGDGIIIGLEMFMFFCAPHGGTYETTVEDQKVSLTVPEAGSYTNVFSYLQLVEEEDLGIKNMWFEIPEREIIKKIDTKYLPDNLGSGTNIHVINSADIGNIDLSAIPVGDIIALVSGS